MDVARSVVIDEPMTDKTKKSLSSYMRIPDDFLEAVAAAADAHKSVIGVGFDSASVRSAIAYEKEQRPVAAQARALAQRVEEQIIARKADAAESCLGLYQVMKGAARLKSGTELRPVVKQLAELLPKRKRSNKAPPATASPPPEAQPPQDGPAK